MGAVKRDAEEMGADVEVEVDGGVKTNNLLEVLKSGADTIVIGSSIFGSDDVRAAAEEIRVMLDSA